MRTLSFLLPVLLWMTASTVGLSEEYGMAAMYSPRFEGSRTANGEIFKHEQYTASHKTLPFGSKARITRLDNNRSVVVRINDRGPYVSNRVTDLSKAAAERLGFSSDDQEIEVKFEAIDEGEAGPRVSAPVTPSLPPVEDALTAKGITEPKSVPKEFKTITRAPKKTVTREHPVAFDVSGVYKIKLNKPGSKGFAVQIASVNSQENMLRYVAGLERRYYENILVNVDKKGEDAQGFKIFLGPFGDKIAAESYLRSLKKKGLKGFVVDLGKFK